MTLRLLATALSMIFALSACDDGKGGDDGANDEVPVVGAPVCQEACAVNDDCLAGFECQSTRCLSTAPGLDCSTDEQCQAIFSGWIPGCSADEDCYNGAGVCISVDSTNYCTFEKGGDCVTGTEVVVDRADNGSVTVCGNATGLCAQMGEAYVCLEPECAQDIDCTGTKTRCFDELYCGCKDDTDCDFIRDGGSRCLSDGGCGCTDASQCLGNNEDICKDGECGCSSAAACLSNTTHPSTTWVCER